MPEKITLTPKAHSKLRTVAQAMAGIAMSTKPGEDLLAACLETAAHAVRIGYRTDYLGGAKEEFKDILMAILEAADIESETN